MSLKGLINFFNLDGMDEEDEFENYVDDYEEEAPQRTTAARSSRNTAKESCIIGIKSFKIYYNRKKKEKWVDSADQNPK